MRLINDELQRSEAAAKELSEKYVELYDFAPTGYMSLSLEGLVVDSNFAAGLLLERNRSQLTDNAFEGFVSLECRSIFANFLAKVFESAQKENCEIVISPNGYGPKHVYVTGIFKRDHKQCLITLSDITERKLAEKALQKARDDALSSERLKTSFLDNLSHEIITPINAILGFAELLKSPKLTSESQFEYIRMIKMGGSRLMNIFNDIISMSQIDSDNSKIILEEININESIMEIHDFFMLEAREKDITLKVSKSIESSTQTIITDQDKFYGIFSNLIKNGIKFTEGGSVEFGYKRNDQYWEFFVKDTGIGISEINQNVIFDRFRQVDDSLTRKHDGSGLGLSIAKAYVEMLGGKIWIGDSSSEGTIFHFTIPVHSTI